MQYSTMHGMYDVKIIAQQAKTVNFCKNTKFKQLRTCLSEWFNKQCEVHQLTPKCEHVHLNK